MFLLGLLLGLSVGLGLGYAVWRYVFNKPAISIPGTQVK